MLLASGDVAVEVTDAAQRRPARRRSRASRRTPFGARQVGRRPRRDLGLDVDSPMPERPVGLADEGVEERQDLGIVGPIGRMDRTRMHRPAQRRKCASSIRDQLVLDPFPAPAPVES